MLRTSPMPRGAALPALLAIALGLALAVTSCGKNPAGYVDPTAQVTTTHTPTALIDAATLRQWMDEGKVNNTSPTCRDRVVIVLVGTPATYGTGHIPGAVLWNSSSELTVGRLEAVAALTSEPPAGPAMDALIQRMGIDRNTTVVLSVSRSQNVLNMTRAYFTLRYWGFARNRIKCLQGGDDAWLAAGNTLTTEVPVVRPSHLSVRDLYAGSTASVEMRAPIGEMIDVVDRMNTGALDTTSATGIKILDVRGGVDPAVGPYVYHSKVDDYNQYLVTGALANFKPTADMVARLATFGVTARTSLTYVYCASGHRASSTFFLLDGILGWPVKLYDGSSGQWLSYRTANVAAAWRIDVNTAGTTLPRTFGTVPTNTTLALDPVSNTIFTSVADPRANQIGLDDKAYMSSSGSSGSGDTGDGGGGGPSGC